MKKNLTSIAVVLIIALTIAGCKKNSDVPANKNELSPAEVTMIKAAGLSPTGAIAVDGRYLIERDLLLTAAELRSLSKETGPQLIVANAEQYRTTNIVQSLPRTINLRYVGNYPALQTALLKAMNRFNVLNLSIKFENDLTRHAHIKLRDVSGAPYIAAAGFPSAGEPYNTIYFNTNYSIWDPKTLATVLAHELGHCIGFRHTDYMNRFSCGGLASNEGAGDIGAIHIPGTPIGFDPNSWMLACIDNGINRNFNPNDIKALDWIY